VKYRGANVSTRTPDAVRACERMCVRVCTGARVCACMCACMRACMWACVRACVLACACVCAFACACHTRHPRPHAVLTMPGVERCLIDSLVHHEYLHVIVAVVLVVLAAHSFLCHFVVFVAVVPSSSSSSSSPALSFSPAFDENRYYGGPSLGFNGAEPVHEPSSPNYDPKLRVVLWYSDFYGHLSPNLPVSQSRFATWVSFVRTACARMHTRIHAYSC
jgi:hypothetical protein